MKTFITFVAAILLAQTRAEIDWSNVTPLDVNPFNLGLKGANSPTSPRIVGGNEVVPHSVPYQAALLIKIGSQVGFCGGSIIAPNFILTAAHCVDQTAEVEVVLGAHNIVEHEETQQRIVATEFIVHPDWSPLTLSGDIALVKLPQDIQYNDIVQPIRLTSHSAENSKLPGKKVRISGWGKDSDKATAVSPILRDVHSKVISLPVCKLFYFGIPDAKHVCTNGKGGIGACSGDSGGPLAIVEDDGEPTVVGVVSFGIAFGCELGWPSVFTGVNSYLDWIHANTGIAIRD